MEGIKRQGGRVRVLFYVAAFAVLALAGAPAAVAFDFSFSDDDFDWGEVDFTWNTRLTVGAQIRTQRRDRRLIDKQNLDANQDIPISGTAEAVAFSGFGLPFYNPANHPSTDSTGAYSGRFDLCEIGMPQWYAWNQGNWGFGEADCTSQTGDPRHSMRLHNAPGGYNINGDDGNLNYDRGDVTYANFQVRSELTAHWRDLTVKVSGIGYYDPVNNDFDTHLADRGDLEYWGRTLPVALIAPSFPDQPIPPYPNTAIYPLAERSLIDRSGFTQRQDDEEDRLGEQLRLLEAYVAYNFDVAGRKLRVGIGDQRMRWGESTFMIFNNLARINPPSAELYDRPGTEVRDAFIPVGMVTASMNVTTNFNVEAFYQYDWEPVEPSVCGSFLSVSDVAGCGEGPTPIYLASGNAPEAPNAAPEAREISEADPFDDFRLGGLSGSMTNTSRTIYLEDESFGYPSNGGQYGLRLDYYADFNGGTELSLYGMNIHSRLPYFSVLAAACDVGEASDPDSACPFSAGFDGDYSGSSFIGADRKYRVDSMRAFLDYPEDVKIYGMSATTNLGDWSLAGELAYSPNQPAQVSLVDVVYAGIQPALPTNTTSLFAGPWGDDIDIALPQAGDVRALRQTPLKRVFAPDYLMSRYRCDSDVGEAWENEQACANAIEPGQYIRGYERLKVGQISLTGIRVFGSSNLINADQIIFVGELAATKVFDMPGLDEVQFQGSSASQTHYSQGQADWTPEYGPFVAHNVDLDGDGTDDLMADDPVVNQQGELLQEIRDAGYTDMVELCGSGFAPTSISCYRKLGPTDRVNPERADEDDFADDFAWGYRMRVTATYRNMIGGIDITPGLEFYHDVHGTSIYPGQDFVEGRKRTTLSADFLFTNNFSGRLAYRIYAGAGERNLRRDRDYAEMTLSYAF